MILAGFAVLGTGGCGGAPAAADRLELMPGEAVQKGTLTGGESRAVQAALAGLTRGAAPADTPGPAARPRWSDVRAATDAACDEVQAAVFGSDGPDAGAGGGETIVFRLRTIEDHDGELTVQRDAAGAITADARFGLFPGEPRHRERAAALVTALLRNLDALARKRGFD